ncbi:unnamed protein product [Gongylonema pulchrum]|uniref:Uncharacterized protein n=1 Tax=Gongylonema pulchrum TaxID=637853 RepID=A0A183EUV5_9BILA|nr:unnamed protein product [Gongylonema pulchrum]
MNSRDDRGIKSLLSTERSFPITRNEKRSLKGVQVNLPTCELPDVEEWSEDNTNGDGVNSTDRRHSAEAALLSVHENNAGLFTHFINKI